MPSRSVIGSGRRSADGVAPDEGAPLAVIRGFGIGLEELDHRVGAGFAGDRDVAARDRGAVDHGKVEQIVRTRVAVAAVIAGHAVGAQVDAELRVRMDLVALNEVAGAAGNVYAVARVERDDVSLVGAGAADPVVVGSSLYFHAIVRAVPTIEQTGRVGADVVALDDVVVRVDLDALEVVRDHVACRRRRAADRVVAARDDREPDVAVARSGRAVGQKADPVALDDVVRRAAADDRDPFVIAVRDQVAIAGAGAADRDGRTADVQAVVGVAHQPGGAALGADPVAGDRDAVGAGLHQDAVAGKTRDHQPAQDASVAGPVEIEPVLAAAEVVSVDADDRVVGGVVRLGRGVDDHGIGDRGQRALDGVQGNDVRTGAGDVEVDFVGRAAVGGRVRRLDRFAQRDLAVGPPVAQQRVNGGRGAVDGVGDRRDLEDVISGDVDRFGHRRARAAVAVIHDKSSGARSGVRIGGHVVVGDVAHERLRRDRIRTRIEGDHERRRAVGSAREASDNDGARAEVVGDVGARKRDVARAGALVVDGEAIVRGAVGGEVDREVAGVVIRGIDLDHGGAGIDDGRAVTLGERDGAARHREKRHDVSEDVQAQLGGAAVASATKVRRGGRRDGSIGGQGRGDRRAERRIAAPVGRHGEGAEIVETFAVA